MGTHPIFESDFDCLTGDLILETNEKNVETVGISEFPIHKFHNFFRLSVFDTLISTNIFRLHRTHATVLLHHSNGHVVSTCRAPNT